MNNQSANNNTMIEEVNIMVSKSIENMNSKLNNADNYLEVFGLNSIYVCNRTGNRVRKFSNQNIEIAKQQAREYFYKTFGYVK